MKELSKFQKGQKVSTEGETNYFDMLINSDITIDQEQIIETAYAEFPNEDTNHIEIDTCPDNNISIDDLLDTSGEDLFRKEYNNHKKCDPKFAEALSDHNYTSQEVNICQPNLKMIRDMILNLIIPSSSTENVIPRHIWNFIENTINNVNLYRIEYKETQNTQLNQHQTRSTNSSSQERIIEDMMDNLSEPLEFNLNDHYLTNMYNDFENQIALKPLLKSTMNFAKQLYYECKTFALKSEDELKVFICEKLKKFKEIAIVGSVLINEFKDINSKNSMNKHPNNFKAKINLLATSGYLHTDIDFKSCSDEIKIESSSENRIGSCLRTHVSQSSEFKNLHQHFSDDIDLSNYIKLDIIGEAPSNEFDRLDKHNDSRLTDNDTDKEIERLINLNVLSIRKRHKTQIQLRKKVNEKSLERSQFKSVPGFEDDMVVYESEPTFDNENNIISEVEFISRYNEQIKHQLLNDSNSDSGLSNQSNYGNSKDSESEVDDIMTNIVDKFLHVFKSDNNLSSSAQLNKNVNAIKEIKTESQCNLEANDTIITMGSLKTSKLPSDSELKHPSSIILSSESDASDIEHKVKQSRFIKPMLRIDQLAIETRAAQKNENERIRRLEKKNTGLLKALKNRNTFMNKSDLILDYIESTNTFVAVDVDIVKQLKPHQKDGVKFMYDSCYGGIDHTDKNSGSGCILAHCMGLGKTLQLIALLHTVMSYEELNTFKMLVLCPKSTVMNWADEFHYWLSPLKNRNNIKVFIFPDSSDVSEKLRVLKEWSLSTKGKAGCLLLGYEAFRALVFYHSYKYKGNVTSSKLENIRDKVKKYLLKPGADIVVCDEGHIIKNSKSAISLAVSKIKTPKRIVLTGTPIQNNLKEYYSMVNFIKPLYLGTEREFANLYANPIKNGQHKDSSKKDITIMKQRSYVLHKKLSKFVQRKEAQLLKSFLPQKFEYVLFIPMTLVQISLYKSILEAIAGRGESRGKSLITDYTVLRKIWTHPKVLEDAWKNANKQKSKKDNKKMYFPNSDEDQPDDIYDSQTGVMSVTNDWWRKYLVKKDLETILPSNKLRVMFSILRMCEEKGEKCLIFSAFVAVLNVVEYFFKKVSESDAEMVHLAHTSATQKTSSKWISGQDYYRLDGKTPKNIRHEMIKRFNSETNRRARVFLISSRAGGQGINLIGANRVIILDTSWNPSNDQQNIFRIFRLGQSKNCYIYRLIAMGTMEEKVYSRSVTKQAMSFRVVDEQQIDRHYNMAELAELYTLTTPQKNDRSVPVLPKDTILADLLRQSDLVYKYHEHDSLLENKVEQELSEQEKSDAWETYEKELHLTFEQKGNSDIEKLQNNIHLPGIPSYLANYSNFDMQTFLNYSMGTPFNYSLNQNYFDGFNYYQKYSPHQIDSYIKDHIFSSSSSSYSVNPIFTASQNLSSNLLSTNIQNINPSAGVRGSSSGNDLSTLDQYKHLLGNPLNRLLNYPNQNYAFKKGKSQEQIESSSIRKPNTNIVDDYFAQEVGTLPQSCAIKTVGSVDFTIPFSDSKRAFKNINKRVTNPGVSTDHITSQCTKNTTPRPKKENTTRIGSNFSLTEKKGTQSNYCTKFISKESPSTLNSISNQFNEISSRISLTEIDAVNNNDKTNVQNEEKSLASPGPSLTISGSSHLQNKEIFGSITSISEAMSKNVNQVKTRSEFHFKDYSRHIHNIERDVPYLSDQKLKTSLSGSSKKNDKSKINDFTDSFLNKCVESEQVKPYLDEAMQNINTQDSEHLQKRDKANVPLIRKTVMKRPADDQKDCQSPKRNK